MTTTPIDVLSAALNLVMDYPGGAVALAPQIGKTHSTLSHELSRDYPTYKLGLADAAKLTVLSRDARIAEALAACAGGRFVPNADAPQPPCTAPLEALGHLAREFGELMGQASGALADGHVTLNELRAFERELGQLISATTQLAALVQQAYKGSATP